MEPINETSNKKHITLKLWDREKDSKILKIIAILIVISASSIIIKDEIIMRFVPSTALDFSISDEDISLDGEADLEENDCNVYPFNLHGEVVTYNSPDSYNENGDLIYDQTSADEVTAVVELANEDEKIKAVVVEIDSSGGQAVAGEEIMNAFKNSKKPVVVFIRNRGLSAAYLAATGAQTIFASKLSDVGSIGVTFSYLENTEKNKKEGLKFIDLSAGKFKESGNPDRPLTEEEKRLFMRDVNLTHEHFIQMVAENRKLNFNKVRQLADGFTLMGEDALKNGLIDKIGDLYDVKKFLKEQIGEDVEFCW